jgi:hypothetical protein
LPKGSIEPFNKSGVNPALTLRGLNEPLNHPTTALHNPTLDGQLTGGAFFDHLHNGYLRPGSPLAPAWLTKAGHFGPKRSLKSFDIAGQAIHRQQQGPTQGQLSNLPGQSLDQAFISVRTYHPTQPQPGRDHHPHRHPDDTPLHFHFDFVRLHLTQIKLAAGHQMLMYLLTMFACSVPPVLDCPLIKAKGGYNRLNGAPIGQQGDDQHHLHWICFQPVEDRSLFDAEGLCTDITIATLFHFTVDTDVAATTLASCRTLNYRAKYLTEVHWAPLLVVVTKEFAYEPLFFQIYPFSTVLCSPTHNGCCEGYWTIRRCMELRQ